MANTKSKKTIEDNIDFINSKLSIYGALTIHTGVIGPKNKAKLSEHFKMESKANGYTLFYRK